MRFVWHGHELENIGTGVLIFCDTCSLVLADGEGFFNLSMQRLGHEPQG